MFCQSCGAQNSNDAKFCNQCGSKIARVGEAGGPIPGASTEPQQQPPVHPSKAKNHPGETAVGVGVPPAAGVPDSGLSGVKPNAYHPDTGFGGQSMLGVSLAGIGVKSSKKIWATILLIAVALVALGAVGSWLARGEPEVIAEAGHAEPDDPFVIGTPLPEGDEGPDFVSGSTGDPATPSMGSTMAGTTTSGTMTSTGTMTTEATTETMTATMSTPTMTTTMSTMTTAMTPTMTTSMETTMETTMDTATMETTMETTMDSSSSMDVGEEVPEERDLEMELYSSRVRFVIRRYYAARAQACFDRATRNNPTVSGTVVINMSIGEDGAVSRSTVGRNTTGDSSLGNCLENQVSTWRLPPPPGGGLDMQMPFSR